jgi:hypothetical protein
MKMSRLQGGRWLEMGIHGNRNTVHAPPFDAVEIDGAEWWSETVPE